MTKAWLTIVGVGPEGPGGLTPDARQALAEADHVVCAERHAELLAEAIGDRPVHLWPAWHKARAVIEPLVGQDVVVIGTGDPFNFGVGTSLVRWFGSEALRVFPVPSAFARAAARLGWPLQSTPCLSAYGRSLGAVLVQARVGQQMLVLGDGNLGVRLSEALGKIGLGATQITALSQMDGEAEARRDGLARDWTETVDPLTTWALTINADEDTNPAWPAVRHEPFGLPDDAFKHDGKLTKREMRAVTLSALLAAPGGNFWDIGGGSGAIGLEWLRARPMGQVFAIEPHGERRGFMEKNARRFGFGHDERDPFVICGAHAPDAYERADFAPDAVFVGGGLSREGVLEKAWQALVPGGVLVANAVTLEGQAVLTNWRDNAHGEFTTHAVARGEKVGRFTGLRPLMPVLQWVGRKP